jgi:hypothetical protein
MEEFEAAVNESNGESPSMEVAGRVVLFPAKLPLGLAAAVQMQRADVVYRILANGASFAEPVDEDADDEVLVHLMMHLSEEDFDRVAALYGTTVPNSQDSAG